MALLALFMIVLLVCPTLPKKIRKMIRKGVERMVKIAEMPAIEAAVVKLGSSHITAALS